MKDETIEEAAERLYSNGCDGTDRSAEIYRRIFIAGAKWQAEKMYSEEEVMDIIYSYRRWGYHGKEDEFYIDIWFEQFKKK